jgi:DNA-binding HxlR family transcriptional regulator
MNDLKRDLHFDLDSLHYQYRSVNGTIPGGVMTSGRGYGQACPVAHALDMIGERWALLVVRELRLGPRRYVDLQTSLPGLGPSVLAQRLRDLQQAGVIRRRTLPAPAGSRVYELTEWGSDLEPVLDALARWGVRSPVVPLEGELTDDSVMLGLRTFFDRGAAPPWTATYHVRLARDSYRLEVVRGRLVGLARAEPRRPVDATIETTRETLMSVRTGAESLEAAARAGRLTMTGDVQAVRRLLAAGGGSGR